MQIARVSRTGWLFALAASALVALPAHAVVPVVKTVPWVAGNPLIPHTTYAGKVVHLKGTSDQQGAGFVYTWDFGDGSPSATGTVANRYAIEAEHAYTGPVGTVYTARLTVTDTGTGEAASKVYFVEMQAKSLAAEVNVAIDEGLWYLHKTQYRSPGGCTECGNWQSGGMASSSYHSVTAANLNAFLVNGHKEGVGSANPYAETVRRGMRFLFTQLSPVSLAAQPDMVHGGSFNPDANANGIGLHVAVQEGYQTGMFLSAIVASGTPNAIAETGPASVLGRRYVDIAQDMVDWMAYCQYDGSGAGGGWRYSCNTAPDNSISQWMAIGILGARNFGATVPDVVRQWNLHWLTYSQAANGQFGYTDPSPIWGPYGTTPSGMVQLAMDGVGRGTSAWNRAETFMRENWDNGGGPTTNVKAYYYGLFAFTKALLLHDPTGTGAPLPVQCLRSLATSNPKPPVDWYGSELGKADVLCGGTPASNGLARTLVNDQAADGYWHGHDYDGSQQPFETAWAIMMLNRTVFESGAPVAVAKAIPNPAVAGQLITLDGGDSFHQDAARTIDSWQWDLNGDGVWDLVGPTVKASFPALGDYPVTLRVTDDGAPEKAATTTMIVRVALPPLAPTAHANGPYNFCPATTPWYLDGTGSVNPDQGLSEPGRPGDTMTFAWDLDGDGLFETTGAQPNVSGAFPAPGNYLVQLRVTDTTATSFPSSGQPNLTSTASAVVNVRASTDPACACIGNLAARAKAGKIQLTWTDVAGVAAFHVYRGTTSGGPYLQIAQTASTYSTYLDAAVANGTPYYYVVRRAAANGDELCQSNQAGATASMR